MPVTQFSPQLSTRSRDGEPEPLGNVLLASVSFKAHATTVLRFTKHKPVTAPASTDVTVRHARIMAVSRASRKTGLRSWQGLLPPWIHKERSLNERGNLLLLLQLLPPPGTQGVWPLYELITYLLHKGCRNTAWEQHPRSKTSAEKSTKANVPPLAGATWKGTEGAHRSLAKQDIPG